MKRSDSVPKTKGYSRHNSWDGFVVRVKVGGKTVSKCTKTEEEAKQIATELLVEQAGIVKAQRESANPEMTMLRNRFCEEIGKGDLTAAMRTCLAQAKARNRFKICSSPDFKQLKKVCYEVGKRWCSSCITVKHTNGFHKCAGDYQRTCIDCAKQNLCTSMTNFQKRRGDAQQAASASHEVACLSRNNGAAEDAFVGWVKQRLEALGVEVLVMEEFRHADLLVRKPAWPEDTYVRIQAKADSGMQKDKTAPKAVTARISFNNTLGYGATKLSGQGIVSENRHAMLMLLGAKRAETMEALEAVDYTVWCFDGRCVGSTGLSADAVTMAAVTPIRDHRTGAKTTGVAPVTTIGQVIECIDAAYNDDTFFKTTRIAAMLDVTHPNQRKEMVLMLCLKQAFDLGLTFPTGFQTTVDCVFEGLPTQFKTYDAQRHKADCAHRIKTQKSQPYDVRDGVALFGTGFLVRCKDRYFFFYARETCSSMLSKGHVNDVANGVTNAVTSFRPPMPDKYHQWLWGRVVRQHDSALLPFLAPREVWPDSTLTQELLAEVSYVPVDTAAMADALDPNRSEACSSKVNTTSEAMRCHAWRAAKKGTSKKREREEE